MMTVEQTPSPVSTSESNVNKNENEEMTCQDIGLIFAREYYTFLNKKPSRLHGFYGADSLFTRGDEAESVPIIQGQEEIRKKIQELDFDNCKVLVTQVDSQLSSNNGIIISVLGELSNKEMPSQKFSETFFLAPQPNGYYILNNIFRFLKDKVDINYYTCEGEDEEEVVVVEKVDRVVNEKEKKGEKNGALENVVPPVANIKEVPKIEEKEEEKPKAKKPDQQVEPLDTKNVETKPEAPSKEPEVQQSKELEVQHPKKPEVQQPKEPEVQQPKEPEVKPTTKELEVIIKKEKPAKKTSNKKTDEQPANMNNNIPSIKNKEHTNNKNEGNNKSETITAKDQSKPNNQRGINKPNNNVVKTWADLAAPTAPAVPVESTETVKPPQQNQYQQQYRAQLSQQPAYSPNMHVQNNTLHHHQQQHSNTSYNYQHQHNTHNYNHHQTQQQPQPQQQQQQHYQHHNKDGQHHHNHHRRDTQIFVKNVNSSMTETLLEEAFSKFGPVKHINIGHAKNCAFIDFGSIESTQKALEQHKVMVGGVQVLAEERRPPRYNNNNNNNHRQQYDNNNNNNNRRFQQNKRNNGGGNNRGGSSGGSNNPLDKRGGGGGGGGQK